MSVSINGNGSITGLSVGGLPDGSVDADSIAAGAVTNAKLGTGIDSAKIGAGDVSNTEHAFLNSISSNVQTQIAGAGTPVHYFDVHLNSNLSLSDSADTKVTGFTENQDSSNWFANDRFTPQLAGRYWIMASGELGTGSGSSLWHNGNCSVKRNGTAVTLPTFNNYSSYTGQQKNTYSFCNCQHEWVI